MKMLFVLTVHSYPFLPYLYKLSHRLTELNVSLFYLIELVFVKIINVKAIKLNFI